MPSSKATSADSKLGGSGISPVLSGLEEEAVLPLKPELDVDIE